MSTDVTLTSYVLNPWDGTYQGGNTDKIELSYADLDFIPSASDSYKSTSGDVFKLYVDGKRIYRRSDQEYASGSGFLEDGDSSTGSTLNGLTGTVNGNTVSWLSTTDSVWTIDTANQKIVLDVSEVGDADLYGSGTSALDIGFTQNTTIVTLTRAVQNLKTPAIDFSNASILTEQDLDNSAKNVFHTAQQAVISTENAMLYSSGVDAYSAAQPGTSTAKRIINVATPTADTDAVNKGFISTNLANIDAVAAIASDVTTVAGDAVDIGKVAAIDANVTKVANIDANVTTVAGIDANVTTVAGDAVDIGKVATIDANVTKVANIDANVTKVADIDANVTKVADIDTNVTKVADIDDKVTSVAGKETEVGLLGVAGVIEDMGYLGTAAVVEDMSHLGTSANVTVMGTLGTGTNVTNMANLNASGVISNIGTVATNLTNVNSFANTYFGAHLDADGDDSEVATHISTNSLTLGAGDLYYNKTTNSLDTYNGSSWESLKTIVGGSTVTSAEGANLTLTTVDDHENVVINSTTGTSGNTILLPKVRATSDNYVLAMSDKTTGETEWAVTQISPALTSFTGKLNAYEAPYAYTATTVKDDATLTLITTTNLVAGQYISGTGIPAGTTISSITTPGSSNDGTIELSAVITTDGTNAGVAVKIQKTPGEKSGGTLVLTGTDFGTETSEITVQIFAASSGGTGIAATYISSLSETGVTAEWTGNEASYNGFSGNYHVEIKKGSLTSDRVSSGENMTGDPSISNFTVANSTSSVTLTGQKATLGTYGGGNTAGGGSDANTKLLLNFDRIGGTDIEDSSNTGGDGHKVIATNAVIKASPFGDGKSAMFFDGTDDKLTMPNSDDFTLGATWTVEFWVNFSVLQDCVFWEQKTSSTALNMLWYDHSNTRIWIEEDADVYHIWDFNPVAYTWYHIAYSVDSGTPKCFINGVEADKLSTVGSVNFSDISSVATIGMRGAGDRQFEGYLDDFRIVKGTAVYTSNFTVPTSRLSATQSNQGTNIADITGTATKLLIHSNAQIKDSAPSPIGFSINGQTGLNEDNTRSNWGNSAIDNPAGSGLAFPPSSAFDFGTADFCIEWWYKGDNLSGKRMFTFDTSSPGLMCYVADSGSDHDIVFNANNADVKFPNIGSGWHDGNWHHFAFTKTGITPAFYLDGVAKTVDGTNDEALADYDLSNSSLGILADPDDTDHRIGFFDDFRITVNSKVYTANFTAPTGPLTTTWDASTGILENDTASNVKILLQSDGGEFKDVSESTHSLTVSGALHTQAHGGIAPAMAFLASGKLTGSTGCYFDGAGDYLTITNTTSTVSVNSIWSLDFWVYPQANTTYGYIIDTRPASGNTDAIRVYTTTVSAATGNYLSLNLGHALSSEIVLADNLEKDTWTHVAIQQTGTSAGDLKCYFNGVEVGATKTGPARQFGEGGASSWTIGSKNSGGLTHYLKGYIDSLRVCFANDSFTGAFDKPTKIYGATGAATTNIGTITLTGSATPTADVAFTEMASSLPAGLSLSDSGTHGATITGTLTAPVTDTTTSNIRIQAKAGDDDTRVTEINESNQVGALTLTSKATGAPVLFNARRYIGNDLARDITGFGFKPDLVWFKNRDNASQYHRIHNSMLGGTKVIYSNHISNENTMSGNDGYITSFDSDGVSITTDISNNGLNTTGDAIIAWAWKAGGVPSANDRRRTDDSSSETTLSTGSSQAIGANVYGNTGGANHFTNVKQSVNSAGKFSITTYTSGSTTSNTHHMCHGLSLGSGEKPDLVICKSLGGNGDQNWAVWHKDLPTPTTQYLVLNENDYASATGNQWGNTGPNQTSVMMGDAHLTNYAKYYIMYCWKAVAGVSAFGYWDHDNSTSGTLDITKTDGGHTGSTAIGFQPRMVIIKNIDSASAWMTYDSFRETNATGTDIIAFLNADNTNVENTNAANPTIQWLSGGFQIKVQNNTNAELHKGTDTYIFAAFA